MRTPASSRHLKIASMMVLTVLTIGTLGYIFIEHLSFVDALYTAVNMMATIGNVIHPITTAGRIFTIFVIIFGVGSVLYTFGAGMEFMIEGHFNRALRRYIMDKKIEGLKEHAIICGYGRVGSQIARDFVRVRQLFIVVDANEDNVQECLRLGYLALCGDATTDDMLREAGVERARCVLVATDNDAHNLSITLSVRYLNHTVFIVARANRTETEAKLKMAGADRVISPYTIGGHRMASLAFQPTVTEFFDSLTSTVNPELSVLEVKLSPKSVLIGKTITQVQSALHERLVFVAIKKKAGLLIGPGRDALIEDGDTIILVGAPDNLAAFQSQHGQ
jgi:voltage-gated potassium channel